jgi:hypothetical protein
MKIRPVRAELFQADGRKTDRRTEDRQTDGRQTVGRKTDRRTEDRQTDRQRHTHMTKLIVAFRKFVSALKTAIIILKFYKKGNSPDESLRSR